MIPQVGPHQSNTPPTAHRVGQTTKKTADFREIGAGKMAGLSQMDLMSLVLQFAILDRRFEGVLVRDINDNCL